MFPSLSASSTTMPLKSSSTSSIFPHFYQIQDSVCSGTADVGSRKENVELRIWAIPLAHGLHYHQLSANNLLSEIIFGDNHQISLIGQVFVW